VPDEGLDQLGDEQLERPSIGQLIAGVKQPSYMPRPAAPDASAAPPPDVRPQLDPNAIPDAIRPRTMPAPNEVARPPVGVNSQRRLDLMGEESRLNKPTDPSAIDPKTGKPMYRYGTGAKIIGTIANALGTFGAAKEGRSYTPVDYFGPGATNWKFGRDEELRKGKLAGVQQDLGEQEKLEGSQQKSFEDIVNEASKQQLGEARLATAKAQQEKADILQRAENRKETTPPVNKIGDAATQREALADKMGLKGSARSDYILTGKLPKEFTDPNAPKRGSKFDFDKIEKDKGKAFADAEKRAEAAIGKLNKPPAPLDPDFKDYVGNPAAWKESKKQEIYAQLEKEKSQAQSEYEARIQEKGGAVSTPGAPARPAPSAKAAAPKAPPKVGDTINVDGKPHKVVGFNPKTKKPIVSPIAGQ
jgi:hypothetical protein